MPIVCWILHCENEAAYQFLNIQHVRPTPHPICTNCARKLERLIRIDPEARRQLELAILSTDPTIGPTIGPGVS